MTGRVVVPPGEPGASGGSSAPAGTPARIVAAIRRFQESARQGDGAQREAAFRLLYETYFRAIQRFFSRRGASPDDALDLTQETFFGIYKGLETYEHRERFEAWMFRVATTTYLKWRRRAATAKRSGVEIPRDAMENPETIGSTPGRQLGGVLAKERRKALRAAVEELPEQMRDCLTLRLYHDLAYQEIAVVKKVSTETVKAHLFRARKRLREALADLVLGDSDV
jgi:RNA polymerase sigma factor (sigma-70 family)